MVVLLWLRGSRFEALIGPTNSHPMPSHAIPISQVAAHSICIARNWCTSLKIQPKSKSAMKKFRTDSSRSIGPLLAIETVNSELFGNKSTEASVVCKGKELDAEILGCTTMRIFSSPNEDYSSMLPVWTNAQLVPSWKRIYQVFSGLGRLGSLSPSSAAAHSGFKFHKLQVLLRGQLRCVVPNWRGSAEWVRKLKRSQGLRGGHVHDMYTTCTHCQVHLSQDHWFQNRWQELTEIYSKEVVQTRHSSACCIPKVFLSEVPWSRSSAEQQLLGDRLFVESMAMFSFLGTSAKSSLRFRPTNR